MSKIENMDQLRDRLLQTMEDLESGKIDQGQATTVAKLADTVISSLKSEMQYSLLVNKEPLIPFFGEQSSKQLEHKVTKKLL